MDNFSPLYDILKDFAFPIAIAAFGSLAMWIRTVYQEIKAVKETCANCRLENEKRYSRKEETDEVKRDIKEVKASIMELHRTIVDKIDNVKDDILNKIMGLMK